MKYFHTLWAKASLFIRCHFRLILHLVLLLWLAVLSPPGPLDLTDFFPSLISPSLAFIHLTPDNRLSIVWGRNRYIAHSIMDKLAYQNLFQFKGQGRAGAEPYSYWNLVTVPSWTVIHNNPCPSHQERASYLRMALEIERKYFFSYPLRNKMWTKKLMWAWIHSESFSPCGHSVQLILFQWWKLSFVGGSCQPLHTLHHAWHPPLHQRRSRHKSRMS